MTDRVVTAGKIASSPEGFPVLLAAAASHQLAGNLLEAERDLDAALAIDPRHAAALNARGMIALTKGDPAQAAGLFARAADADPAAPSLWLNLAKACRLLGDGAGEKAAIERVLGIDQAHLMALIRLAELHERLGELGMATERWTAVLSLCSAMADLSPELQKLLDHAGAFVGESRESLAAGISSGLAEQLAKASARDRRRITVGAEAMLGKRRIFTNQCHGFHYPFLPADEYFDRELFPWLEELEAATAIIRKELKAILSTPDPGLRPYVEMASGTPQNLWSELDHSLDWSSLHLWREGRRIDEACARAPKTVALLESLPLACIPNRAPTVFFSVLKAGKHIPPHTGVTNTRAIIHLPLIVPDGCAFRVGGEVRAWREGEAFAFDDTIEHEAWNRSAQDRAVLILDVWNPHLSNAEQEMIVRLFDIADSSRSDGLLPG